MKKIILLLSLIFVTNCFGEQSLKAVSFSDQFDSKLELNENTELIIFSSDKNSADIINKIFTELKVSNLDQSKAIYIADISKMPSFVTKLFALPKMRKYEYKIALDRDGIISKDLPQKEDTISLIKVSKFNVMETSFVNNESDFKKAIETFLQNTQTKK